MTLNYNEKQTLGERHAAIKEMESQDLTSSEKLHAHIREIACSEDYS